MAFGQGNELWHPNLILDEDQLIRNAELGMKLGVIPTMGGGGGFDFGPGGHLCVRTQEICSVKISTGSCLPPGCGVRIDLLKWKTGETAPVNSCEQCPTAILPKRVEVYTQQCSRPAPIPFTGSEDGTKLVFICYLEDSQLCDGPVDAYRLSMRTPCLGGGPSGLANRLEACMRRLNPPTGGGPQAGSIGCDAVCTIADSLGTPRPGGGGGVGGSGSYQECNKICGVDDMSIESVECRRRCYAKASEALVGEIEKKLTALGC